jgi:amino acid transporter
MASGDKGTTKNLRGKLSTFDITNLVVGSIIGADIYVATAIASKLVGPASLIVWVVAGIIAIIISISFAYCVMALPKVGGPYAYVSDVSKPFIGFMVGWSMLLAEWFSIAVFPVAFAQYFIALVPGVDALGQAAMKALCIAVVVITNIIGVKAAGRTNDALTLIKLSPLLLIILGGIVYLLASPSAAASHMSPFLTGGIPDIGQALVLIFWAFAGFELSTLPANDVEEPESTIPKALIIGMLIVMAFYLLTNLMVVSSLDQHSLSSSSSPLMDATRSIFAGPLAGVLVLFVGVGALLSILGADESGTMGTSRLAYAMSLDGLLPHQLSKKHPRFQTPYIAIIMLGAVAFVVSLLGGLSALINSSVFLLGIVYLATCISAIFLIRKHSDRTKKLSGKRIVPLVGALLSLLLIVLVDTQIKLVGLAVLAVGIPVYMFFSPKKELTELRVIFLSREERAEWAHRQSRLFLAYPLHYLRTRRLRKAGMEETYLVRRAEERQLKK